MKIVLTGSSSFIGSAAGRLLEERGHSLYAFRHSFEDAPERLPEQADAWIHFAWGGRGSAGRSDETQQAENVRMSLNALKKARELSCSRFLFAGSQAEYGGARKGCLSSESDDCAPVSAYGRAKLAMLQEARAYLAGASGADKNKETDGAKAQGLSYVHMRLFSVYGPGDHAQALIPTLIRKLPAGERAELGDCGQRWNYMHIRDAAAAIVLLAEAEGQLPDVINIATEDIRPLKDYILELADIVRSQGVCGELRFGQRPDHAEGPADLAPSCGRLNALGFRPAVGFREGVEELLAKQRILEA